MKQFVISSICKNSFFFLKKKKSSERALTVGREVSHRVSGDCFAERKMKRKKKVRVKKKKEKEKKREREREREYAES